MNGLTDEEHAVLSRLLRRLPVTPTRIGNKLRIRQYDHVRIKLTEHGKAVMQAKCEYIRRKYGKPYNGPHIDSENFACGQLETFMELFEGNNYPGAPSLFEYMEQI